MVTASEVFWRVARQCIKKSRYPTEAIAKKYADKCWRERGVVLRVYSCGQCGGFHLTKQAQKTNGP